MSRELRFRVWNIEKKVMSKGFTLKEFAYDQDGESGNCDYNLTSGLKESGVYERVDNPVMQYTGLKDKNEKDVYEDDIVKSDWGYGEDICKVEMDSIIYAKLECTISDEIEVIGNVWEHPRLLEAK